MSRELWGRKRAEGRIRGLKEGEEDERRRRE